MGFEVENLDKLSKKFDDLIAAQHLKEAMQDACVVVERAAKKKAPRGSGALRRSIQSEVTVMPNEVTGTIFTPLFYAPYVEYGTGLGAYEQYGSGQGRRDVPWRYQDDEGKWHTTSGMSPKPFLRPALYESRNEINRILGEGVLDD